jgi:hypothetical protein
VQHPLGEHQQHQQPGGHRGLHHHQRGQRERQQLQRPAEDREAGAQQPAGAGDQPARERQTQVLAAGRLLGVHGLERDP